MSSQVPPGIDHHYVEKFKNYQKGKKTPYLVNLRAERQYLWQYTKTGFMRGCQYGFAAGLMYGIYYRSNMFIIKSSLVGGLALGAFHLTSAYYRNEI